MKKAMLALTVIALSFGIAACGGQAKTVAPDYSGVAGVYTGDDIQLTLNADGAYELAIGGEAVASGSFDEADGVITLADAGDNPSTYTIGEGVLTFERDGESVELTKEEAAEEVPEEEAPEESAE